MLKSLVSGVPVYPSEMLVPDKNKTVCITGHREKSILPYDDNPVYLGMTVGAVKLMLYRYIDMAIEAGYTNFISGLAMGTDLWAAEYIVIKKNNNKNIKLFGAIPYLHHADYFSRDYKALLKTVELNADLLVAVNENPDIKYGAASKGTDFSKNLYRDRNYFMVDNSSAAIAFFNNDSGFSGTLQTVNHAIRTGKPVYRFGLKEIYSVIDSADTDIRKIGYTIAALKNVFITDT